MTLPLLDFLELVSFIMRFVAFLVYKGIRSSSSSVRSSTAAQKEQRQGRSWFLGSAGLVLKCCSAMFLKQQEYEELQFRYEKQTCGLEKLEKSILSLSSHPQVP